MLNRLLLLIGSIFLTGCGCRVGPRNLECDSLSYNRALQNSEDTQLLLNIVRMRYRDNPTFLQVGIVSTSYDYKRTAAASLEIETCDNPQFTFNPRVQMDYSEKPTTTFQPLRGETFVKEMLSPIRMETIVLLDAAGWRIDRILRCCAQRMNNIENAPTASGPTPATAPRFREFLELQKLIRKLEDDDAIRIATQKHPKSNEVCVFLILDKNIEDVSVLEKIWKLLDIDHGTYNIRLTPYHGRGHARDEVLMDMRSPLSVLYFLSQAVHVPPLHEFCGKVTVTADAAGYRFDWDEVLGNLFTIHSAPIPCGAINASVCVKYRGNCYYIDDSDLVSKSTFTMLSQLLALQTSVVNIPTPILTLPIGGNS
ncbi:MAG: hypothetical protein WB791_08680 [Waddliaceae bacterium]